jgi:hypothetical protein
MYFGKWSLCSTNSTCFQGLGHSLWNHLNFDSLQVQHPCVTPQKAVVTVPYRPDLWDHSGWTTCLGCIRTRFSWSLPPEELGFQAGATGTWLTWNLLEACRLSKWRKLMSCLDLHILPARKAPRVSEKAVWASEDCQWTAQNYFSDNCNWMGPDLREEANSEMATGTLLDAELASERWPW